MSSIQDQLELVIKALPRAKCEALSAEIEVLRHFCATPQLLTQRRPVKYYAQAESGPVIEYDSLAEAAIAADIATLSLYQGIQRGQGLWCRHRGGRVAIATSRELLDSFFSRFTNSD